MHAWPPPCRPNAPPQPCTRRRAHACTVSTGRNSNDALALLLARLHLHRLRLTPTSYAYGYPNSFWVMHSQNQPSNRICKGEPILGRKERGNPHMHRLSIATQSLRLRHGGPVLTAAEEEASHMTSLTDRSSRMERTRCSSSTLTPSSGCCAAMAGNRRRLAGLRRRGAGRPARTRVAVRCSRRGRQGRLPATAHPGGTAATAAGEDGEGGAWPGGTAAGEDGSPRQRI